MFLLTDCRLCPHIVRTNRRHCLKVCLGKLLHWNPRWCASIARAVAATCTKSFAESIKQVMQTLGALDVTLKLQGFAARSARSVAGSLAGSYEGSDAKAEAEAHRAKVAAAEARATEKVKEMELARQRFEEAQKAGT